MCSFDMSGVAESGGLLRLLLPDILMFLVWVSADVLVAVFTPKLFRVPFALLAFYIYICERRSWL